MKKKKVIILGAAGRDFHNFNVYFRDNPNYEVVAFTATQIPGIEGRKYPKELAGKYYPNGIPIFSEEKLMELIKKYDVHEVVFAYSDVDKQYVIDKALLCLSLGASFRLLGPKETMLKSNKPIIVVSASRTGAGKSTVVQRIIDILKPQNKIFVAIRHPMPYGILKNQILQKFTKESDLIEQNCTIEEIEEYLPYIRRGITVYSGVDYKKILTEAEKESDLIIFECGNNDFSFIKPNLWIVVVDPLRTGGLFSYPGEVNVRNADLVIINKINLVTRSQIKIIENAVRKLNKSALIIKARSDISVDKPNLIKNKRVLVIEDSPTVTHGSLGYAAGYMAAKKWKAEEIVDPKKYATGYLKKVYKEYKHLKNVLPSLAYNRKQLKDLEDTINKVSCDSVILGTPADLRILIKINKPVVQVSYKLKELNASLKNSVLNFIRCIR